MRGVEAREGGHEWTRFRMSGAEKAERGKTWTNGGKGGVNCSEVYGAPIVDYLQKGGAARKLTESSESVGA